MNQFNKLGLVRANCFIRNAKPATINQVVCADINDGNFITGKEESFMTFMPIVL
jgi:hypothetical protein